MSSDSIYVVLVYRKHRNRSPIFQKAHKKLFSALPILFTQKSVDSVVVVGVASDS